MKSIPSLPVTIGAHVLILASLGPPATPQGSHSYLNVETPVVHGLEVTEVAGKRLLLACNTPDNSVEVFDIDDDHAFLLRVPVGLEPNSVQAVNEQVFVTNFLGDSITAFELEWDSGLNELSATVERTVNVGDEPMDTALWSPGNGLVWMFVAFNNFSRLGLFDSVTLDPVIPDTLDTSGNVLSIGSRRIDLIQQDLNPGDLIPPQGLKQARVVEIRNGKIYALGFQGGNTGTSYDLDLLSADLNSYPLVFNNSFTGLGSTNWNMRFASNGDLYVVGGRAHNQDLANLKEVRDKAINDTGFVSSHLFHITGPDPVPTSTKYERDINTNAGGAPVPFHAGIATPTDLALFEDQNGVVKRVFVAGFGSDRIIAFYPPAYHQHGTPSTIENWARHTIQLPSSPYYGEHRGPRSMVMLNGANGGERLYVLNRFDSSITAIDPRNFAMTSFPLNGEDPTPEHIKAGRPLLYNANLTRTENVPSGEVVGGFVSCASCHPDGGSDGLSWRLGDPGGEVLSEMPPTLDFIRSVLGGSSGPPDPQFMLDMMEFLTFDPEGPEDKSHMVTQRLHGLMNSEIEYGDTDTEKTRMKRDLFANSPYHWRGDKQSVRDFNEAFVRLLGAKNLDTSGTDPRGLSEAEMDDLERFVLSISYPPNPKQPKDRRYSTTTNSSGDEVGGSRGLELFHTTPIDVTGQRSCVECHALPEGSNNRIAIFTNVQPIGDIVPGPAATGTQPLESAALRGRFKMEGLFELHPQGHHLDGSVLFAEGQTPRVSQFGLQHTGTQDFDGIEGEPVGINTFVDIFDQDLVGSVPNDANVSAVKQFVQEFDTGVAPIVGSTRLVFQTDLSAGAIPPGLLNEIESEIEQCQRANAGLVVHVHQGSSRRGFSYYAPQEFYVEETLSGPVGGFTLASLAGLLVNADDYLCMTYVPLGSERRFASTTGEPSAQAPKEASNVVLMPMPTITANEEIPGFRDNWVPMFAPAAQLVGVTPFEVPLPSMPGVVLPNIGAGTDSFMATMRLFQYGLINSANAALYGFGSGLLRHEAPRRFRVSGRGLMVGAKLLLSIPYPSDSYVGPGPSTPAVQSTMETLTLEIPLFPTNLQDPENPGGNHEVWESAIEVDPFVAHMLLLGGPRAKGVQDTVESRRCWTHSIIPSSFDPCPSPHPLTEEPIDTTGPYDWNLFGNGPTFTQVFDPDDWNWHRVQIENPGQPIKDFGWQQLRFEAP